MSKVDWSKAPEDAEFYSCGHIYKALGSSLYSASYEKYLRAIDKLALGETLKANDKWSWRLSFHDLVSIKGFSDYEQRPQQWPSESRIDIIGTNGNTAEHYMEETLHQTARVHYETQSELAARLKAELEAEQKAELILNAMSDAGVKEKTIRTASDFLSEGLRILSERGKQYDPSGTKEMSFDNVAEAFNCLTNSRLKGSDVCLILALLKVVRQNANKSFHEDSAVDFVNYAALHSELVRGEKA